MTAFDGHSARVQVFFDSDGEEINVGLSDDPEDYASEDDYHNEIMAISPDEAAELVLDLLKAIILRGRTDIYRDVLVELGSA